MPPPSHCCLADQLCCVKGKVPPYEIDLVILMHLNGTKRFFFLDYIRVVRWQVITFHVILSYISYIEVCQERDLVQWLIDAHSSHTPPPGYPDPSTCPSILRRGSRQNHTIHTHASIVNIPPVSSASITCHICIFSSSQPYIQKQ